MANIGEFEDIYHKYFRYVISIIRTYISQTHDIEDVASDVFTSLWKNYENLDKNSNIKSLIFLITKRRIADFLRKRYKIKSEFVYIDEDVFINLPGNDSYKNEPHKNPLLEELKEHLNDKYKNLFECKYRKNMSSREIANVLGTSIQNVKVMNNRLIKQLKIIWLKMNQKTT